MNLLKQNYFPRIEMLDIGQCYDEVNSGKKIDNGFYNFINIR